MRVKIADYSVLQKEGVLITIGLGSCVGIALYDSWVKVAGLAHILLSDSTLFVRRDNPAKFADTAVPLLIKEMARMGACRSRIKAKIAGGSELFRHQEGLNSVGTRNVLAVRKSLLAAGISLLSEDVGGNVGRTMHLHARDGKVIVAKVGQQQKEL